MVFMHSGMSSRVRSKLSRAGGGVPLGELRAAAIAGLVAILALGHFVFSGITLPALVSSVAVYACAVALTGWLMQRHYPHDRLGFCNVATLSRMMLTASLVMPLVAGASNAWPVAAVALCALALDGMDGWLARREGLVSAFGARFDMEVDSAFALVLSVLAYASGSAGVLVLALGLPRYVFAAAAMVLPWLNGPLPERTSRKVVCVVQLATLIVLQVPGAVATAPLVAVVVAALIWSFGRDIVWLWRQPT
jgi:phosphatidylglycerophosphate synthase